VTDPPAPALLEIALALDGEAAEAVCALFEEHGGGAIVETWPRDGAPDEHHVVTYIPAADVEARARIEVGLWHLGCISPLPEARFRTLAEADWAEAWKAQFQPLRLGRILVTPSWIDPPAGGEGVVLRLDPGMAFGTGLHPTTQLCVAALQDLLQGGEVVLDVGTGSGILAIAAMKLGAARCVAVDIDAQAARVATANAARNAVVVDVRCGGIDRAPDAAYDVVVANLLAGLVIDLAAALRERTRPGGHCIVSGILADQADSVSAALVAAGFEMPRAAASGDWVALVAGRGAPMLR